MLTISKSLSAGQARTYHAREFTSERQNYWSRDQQGHSEWQGTLAKEWGLQGSVGGEEFARLSEGRHPESDAQLVKHQPAKTYDNRYALVMTIQDGKITEMREFYDTQHVNDTLRSEPAAVKPQ